MAIIPDSVIEEIRSRTDIVQVIGDRISLKRGSGGFVACCPFHHENTPSFNVNVQRQRYHCFGCGEDGDVFKFLMQHDGMSFMDAVRYLAEKCGVQVTMGPGDASAARAKRLFQVNAEAASFFRRCLLSDSVPGAAAARAYLESADLPMRRPRLLASGSIRTFQAQLTLSRARIGFRSRRWLRPALGRFRIAPARKCVCATDSMDA